MVMSKMRCWPLQAQREDSGVDHIFHREAQQQFEAFRDVYFYVVGIFKSNNVFVAPHLCT